MTSRFPLIVNAGTAQIQELPAGDELDLQSSNIANVINVTAIGNISADYFTGNVDGATGVFTGNVSSDTFLGNISGDTGVFTGNVSANNLTLTTALPVSSGGTGITGFGTGVATWLESPTSANLAAAVTDETGSGALVFATSPTLVDPVLGTPASGNLANCTADGTNAVGFKNIPAVADKTTSYTLELSDIGKVVGIGSGGSITIPDATFATGDAILIFNNTGSAVTITCSITSAYIAGVNADRDTVSIASRGVCNILFISGTVCVLTGNVS